MFCRYFVTSLVLKTSIIRFLLLKLNAFSMFNVTTMQYSFSRFFHLLPEIDFPVIFIMRLMASSGDRPLFGYTTAHLGDDPKQFLRVSCKSFSLALELFGFVLQHTLSQVHQLFTMVLNFPYYDLSINHDLAAAYTI